MLRNTLRRNKGITLIALVVTIIVILILAGISIAMLTGQNGILNRAAEAKEKTGAAQEDESRKLHFFFDITKSKTMESIKGSKIGECLKLKFNLLKIIREKIIYLCLIWKIVMNIRI